MLPATLAVAVVPTQDPMGLMAKLVHRPGTEKADRMNSGIAFPRRAESLVVPSRPWMLAKGENSLLRRQKALKLR